MGTTMTENIAYVLSIENAMGVERCNADRMATTWNAPMTDKSASPAFTSAQLLGCKKEE